LWRPERRRLGFFPHERVAVFMCIFGRRGLLGEFLLIPGEVLGRTSEPAQSAPYIEGASHMLPEKRAHRSRALKLEGALETPVGVCVICAPSRIDSVVLGRTQQAETDAYAAGCTVRNLWLAARAENVGLGGSVFSEDERSRVAAKGL
jgi:5,6-dimethylbenzimidazole synthase